MNISKFTNNEPRKPFHSSGYAEAANSGSIGSTNSQSFHQRYRIDQNRRAIRKYRDSAIGRGAPSSRAEITNPPKRPGAIGTPRSGFSEPPRRGFNPYS